MNKINISVYFPFADLGYFTNSPGIPGYFLNLALGMAVSSSSGQCQYTFVLSGLAGVGKTAIFKHLKTLTGCTEADRRSPSNDVGGVDCCIYSTVVKGVKCKVSVLDRFLLITLFWLEICIIYLIIKAIMEWVGLVLEKISNYITSL